MKKLLLLITLSLSLLANEKMMQNIYNNVLLPNITLSIQDAKALQSNVMIAEQKILQEQFQSLVASWKKVETFYLAAEFNEDSVDIPRYIDVFHNLKENLSVQMQRVIDSKDDVAIDMYKNSFKTINALEYVLFTGELNERKRTIISLIVDNIANRLDEIKAYYQNDAKKFLTEFKWANDVIINMLIDSSFKLRDWRVGDQAGLSRKYQNKADNKRAEYYLSQTSKKAIEAILLTHKQVMNDEEYDFGDMLIANGFKNEVALINGKIDDSLKNLAWLQNENFEAAEVASLYKSLDELHKAYYQSLVNAVGVSTKILDADGD